MYGLDVGGITLQFGPANGADAVTVGYVVVINANKWNSLSSLGQLELLAHEFTHTEQYDLINQKWPLGDA